ncbi:RNA polymerase III subunit C82 [Malassezia cuniculi]|uniref:DNA-directed RNA polymerase III subunit RPC3 n=1 Tax=Malassezia cuniculi TaxID=948313 RepID=A0AAF0J619_9BASI|nr:RNA polymerase III subunit C82 [Malassezia cuniculi]
MDSASRECTGLCRSIIAEHFGPVTEVRLCANERVATALLQKGRLSVREIQRCINTSSIGQRSKRRTAVQSAASTSEPEQPVSLRLIQQALVTLIQHHCVLHSNPPQRSDEAPAEEYFEVHAEEVVARLRFGTYISLAEEWGGPEAGKVIRYLLYHGQAPAGQIVEHLATYPDGEPGAPGAAQSAGYEQRAAQLRALLVRMIQGFFVRPSTTVQHVSQQDRLIAHEDMLRKSFRGVPTTKVLKEIKGKVALMIDEENRKDWEGPGDGDARLGLKRKADSSGARDKRLKRSLVADVSSGRTEDEFDIDPEVWLRVHYQRFDVHMRNRALVQAVAQKYNPITGEVFRYMLQCDRLGEARSETEVRSRPVSLTSLSHIIPAEVKIQRGLDRRSIEDRSSRAPSQLEFLAEYVAILTDSDNISSDARNTRFLAPSGTGTTVSAGGTAKVPTSFTVEYRNIINTLQLEMIRQMISEQFGPIAARIFSILISKGKLEEKHISKLGLVSIGETRDICSRLFAASLLSLQEVPKSNERNPQRTFFLWFVDMPRCKMWLIDHLYRTLAQLGALRVEERRKHAALLRKVERSDVKEDTERLLAEWERKELSALKKKLEGITVAEARADLDVFIMRHFNYMP